MWYWCVVDLWYNKSMGENLGSVINEVFSRIILDSSERIFGRDKRRKGRIKLKHAIPAAAIFVIAVFSGVYFFVARAEVLLYFPSSCLGTWENPQNVEGEPSLKPNAEPEKFDKTNSAFLNDAAARQIFCGGFQSGNDNAGKVLKRVVLKFSWAMVDVSAPVLEQSEFEEKLLELEPSTKIIVVPDALPSPLASLSQSPEPLPAPNPTHIPTAVPATVSPESKTSPEPVTEPEPEPEVSAKPASSPQTTPTPTLTSTPTESIPTPAPVEQPAASTSSFNFLTRIFTVFDENTDPALTDPALTDPALIVSASEPVSTAVDTGENQDSPSFEKAPFASSSISEMSENLTSASASASASAATASVSFEEDIIGDSIENFFEVLYSTDGQNWNLAANVNRRNFHGLIVPLPVNSWENLEGLQVMINVLPSDSDLPRVFLDSFWLEAEYEELSEEEAKEIGINKLKQKVAADEFFGDFVTRVKKSRLEQAVIEEIKKKTREGKAFVAILGDLASDSTDDFAMTFLNDSGKQAVVINSGSTLETIVSHELEGGYPGIISSLGDIDGDDTNDYAILDSGFSTGEGGATFNERGRIMAYSGLTHLPIWTHAGTVDRQFQGDNNTMMALAGGDYDNDGKPDLLIGAPGWPNGGAILILSSGNGSVIREIKGDPESGGVGFSFAVGPDLNNDSFGEILLSEPFKSVGELNMVGQVRLISGKGFETRFIVKGTEIENAVFGIAIGFTEDLNGDGIADIIVESREKEAGESGEENGAVYIFSSSDGSLIHKFIDPDSVKQLRSVFFIR